MKVRPIASILIGCLFFANAPAHAQFDIGGGFIDAGIHGAVMQGVADDAEDDVSTKPKSEAKPGEKPLTAKQISAILSYRKSAARTRANLQNFVEKSRQSDPAAAAQLEQIFASTDIMAAVENGIKPKGLSITNVADAYAVWWINAWEGSRGKVRDTSNAKIQAVKKQAVAALIAVPAFRKAGDAQKQELAESYFVQAALIEGATTGAQSNPQLLAKVKNAIKQGALASGMNLDSMTLTDAGFVAATK